MSEDRQLKAMRLLEDDPTMTQRQLAEALGVSLGAANYCLKALVEKGWVKLENFQNNPNKLGYLYLLTPQGLSRKDGADGAVFEAQAGGIRGAEGRDRTTARDP